MIGFLRGNVIVKGMSDVLLDVGGVGYEIELPVSTAAGLPGIGEPATLFTHLVVREDAQLLFGFASMSDRSLFRQLIRVKGVGPKLAVGILSVLRRDQLVLSITSADTRTLTSVPGVGKRTAEQIVLDLRDRLEAPASDAGEVPVPADNLADVESALVALGYKPQDASRVLARIESPPDDASALLREALKLLSGGR
jgi:Holliday junction DNA helicase RuvA